MAKTRDTLKKLEGSGKGSSKFNVLKYPDNVEDFINFIEIRRRTPKGGIIGNIIQLYIPESPAQALIAEYDTPSIFLLNTGKAGLDYVNQIRSIGFSGDADDIQKLSDVGLNLGNTVGRSLIPDGELLQTVEAVTRTVQNPAVTYLFKNMSHRSFTFMFSFMPKNEAESNTVRDIIKELKLAQSPSISAGSADRFLKYPDTISVKYRNPEYLHAFKESVIKTVDVNYNAAGGTYSQFKNTAPTAIELTLTFEELNIVTKEDIEEGY